MIFPNQTEFNLEFWGHWQWSSKLSEPIWIWFVICVLQNQFFSFQTKLELVWKSYTILGVTFPNQTGFGLEKDTEWDVASLPPPYSDCHTKLFLISSDFKNKMNQRWSDITKRTYNFRTKSCFFSMPSWDWWMIWPERDLIWAGRLRCCREFV